MKNINRPLLGLSFVVLAGTIYNPAVAAGLTEENFRSACVTAIQESCDNLPEPEQTFCEGSTENLEAICDIAASELGLVLDLARAHGDAVLASGTKRASYSTRWAEASLVLAGSLNVPGGPAVAICRGSTSDADDINLSCASGGTVIEVSPTLAIGFDPTVKVPQGSNEKVCATATGYWDAYPAYLEPLPAQACITANDLVMTPGVPVP